MRRSPKLITAVLGAMLLLAACGSGHIRQTAAVVHRPAVHRHARVRRPSGPLAGFKLWINSVSPAARQEASWRSIGRNTDAALIAQIAEQPTAVWLTGGIPPARKAAALVDAAQRAHAVAQIVLYDIPDRDCGQYSSGGAPTDVAYLSWIRGVVRGLGRHPAIVILEPDAIDQAASGCLNSTEASDRYSTLASAARLLRQDRKVRIYLDAGDAGWLSPHQIAEPLELSGIADDSGFSLNVANFYTTAQSIAYGRRLSALIKGKHFVIDTSRSGNGAPVDTPSVNQWCNPPGRALGPVPTTDTGDGLVDAYLWVKYPGQSDGTCAPGDPPAGQWWPSYALGLVRDMHH